jgi:hypothetical protein
VLSLSFPFVSVREKTDDEREEEEELLRFRVGRALRDERGGAQLPSSSSSSETTRLLTAFFQKNRARKEGKIDQKLKRTELFRGDGPVAVFIEQSERFFEFGDLLVREFSRHDVFVVVFFVLCVCLTRAQQKE